MTETPSAVRVMFKLGEGIDQCLCNSSSDTHILKGKVGLGDGGVRVAGNNYTVI